MVLGAGIEKKLPSMLNPLTLRTWARPHPSLAAAGPSRRSSRWEHRGSPGCLPGVQDTPEGSGGHTTPCVNSDPCPWPLVLVLLPPPTSENPLPLHPISGWFCRTGLWALETRRPKHHDATRTGTLTSPSALSPFTFPLQPFLYLSLMTSGPTLS